MESMPSACLVGDTYPYAQKHNPFLYFNDVRTTTQCSNDVPLTGLATDLVTTTTTPAYAWITPNLCNDMHDCSVATGDTWLSRTVPQILNSPAFTTQNSVLLITWDEDDGSQSNQVPMLVAGPSVVARYRSTTRYNHYSVLKTIEQAWGLTPLTANDSSAAPMSDFFVPQSTSTVRINTGGSAFTSPDGRTWQADTGALGGTSASVTSAIASTQDQKLYESERYGNFTYSFAVPNGAYRVGLRFAEIYWTSRGQRVFNVSVIGQQVLHNFDILAQPNTGPNTALDKTFPVSVTNGQVTIVFTTVVDNAKISAIDIVPAGATRINSGGPAYTGGDGRAWSADAGFAGGTAASVTQAIAKTQDQTLYQSERYGNFSYNAAVPNGTYTVVLKFAEIYWTSRGQRVFNVSINGQQVLSSFDILAQTNTGPNMALDRAFPVTVSNGNINITFTALVDNAKVSAIEIIPGT